MIIDAINPITPLGNLVQSQRAEGAEKNNNNGFGEMLQNALQDVNKLQIDADNMTDKMLTGQVEDIHQVMLASEKAKMALQTTVQIRNKIVEAYQEISRMQI